MVTCTGWQLLDPHEPSHTPSLQAAQHAFEHCSGTCVCVCVSVSSVMCWLPLWLLQVYVLKRPHVDEFLQKMGELFECVLFTASLAKVRSHHAQVSYSIFNWSLLALSVAQNLR